MHPSPSELDLVDVVRFTRCDCAVQRHPPLRLHWSRDRFRRTQPLCMAWLVLAGLASLADAQVTMRISESASGIEGDGFSDAASVSADGRWIAFQSGASNLVPGDTNSTYDIFVHDRVTGAIERVSIGANGAQANANSFLASSSSISADGRFVVFTSLATNLVSGVASGNKEIYVRDRQNATTSIVSVDTTGSPSNAFTDSPSISADGRHVAFQSGATDLVANDTNGVDDVFVRDVQAGITERVSLASSGAQGNLGSYNPSISADGRHVAFTSYASSLVVGDTNAHSDVFVRDRQSGLTRLVSIDSNGVQGNGNSSGPSISGDGDSVAFQSFASNLVPSDTNGISDVFIHEVGSATTVRASSSLGGTSADGSSLFPSLPGNGRFVAFESHASNLVAGDTNGAGDVFVHDRQTGSTTRVSVSTQGLQANSVCGSASLSADGRFVVFYGFASNLVPNDTNGSDDVFLRDTNAAGFTSLCDPATAGVISCPCSNPPSESGRGCDNSAASGGAVLAASGAAYVSMDSLVFTTSSELPTSTSIVLQGTSDLVSGVAFGQGVRCVGGSLKRLYVKVASGGSITAPDFAVGDPSVSARSAALGDMISAGEGRWYVVYYRDPVVLGGCPASSTFNATQTGRVNWSL